MAKTQKSTPSLPSFTTVIAGITVASFALGVSTTYGNLLAIDPAFLKFINFDDIVSQSLAVAPFAILGATLTLVSSFLKSDNVKQLELSTKEFRRAEIILFLTALAAILSFYLLPLSLAFGIIFLLLFPMQKQYFKIIDFKIRDKNINAYVSCILSFLFVLFFMFLLSYTHTNLSIQNNESTHSVCVQNLCRKAKILYHLSIGTILRWDSNHTISIISDSNIKSISQLKPYEDKPFFDIFGFGNKKSP